MRHLALSFAIAFGLTTPARAQEAGDNTADRAGKCVFADAGAVAVVRPQRLLGIFSHLGSAWPEVLRRSLRLPGAVNPLDPAMLAITGIEPNAASFIAFRPLRGGVHVRAALALTEARVAEALVRTMASVLKVELAPGAAGTWQGMFPSGEPLIARLYGDVLVVDWVLPGSTASPTAADLARIIPVKAPRAWKAGKGSSRVMQGNEALLVWVDLVAGGTMSIAASERASIMALRAVDPAQKIAMQRAARTELLGCRHRLDDTAIFDDVTLAVRARDAQHASVTVATVGRAAVVMPPLESTPSLPDAVVRDVELVFANLPREWFAHVGTANTSAPAACDDWSRADWALRRWPRLLASTEWFPLLLASRGAAISLPHLDKPASLAPSQLLGFVRLQPSDVAALEGWSTKLGQAWSLETDLRDALPPDDLMGLLSLGKKSALSPALHGRIPSIVPVSPREQLGSLSVASAGSRRLLAEVPALASRLDGIDKLDSKLRLEGTTLRLDTEIVMRSTVENPR